MEKLLVAVDGSDSALRAVRYAATLGKRAGNVSLHLVNVHEPPLIYGEIAVYVPREKMQALQREHSEAILANAEAIVKSEGVPYTKEICVGNAAEVLAEQAGKLSCNAIVMGTRGLSSIGNLVMGSVATKVIHLTDLPVTLIK